jgi:hypothetical protein
MAILCALRYALLAITLMASFAPLRADDVLFIGNSYTAASRAPAISKNGGVPKLFEAIARARGKQVTTDAVIAGGKGWDYHLKQPITLEKLSSKPWTWVVLQNESDQIKKLGIEEFLKEGDDFYGMIAKACPGAKIVLYETWARPTAYFKGDASAPPAMMKSVHEGYLKLQANLAAKAGGEVRLAPVGSAFLSLEGPGVLNLHDADHHHSNNDGYYLAALVIYETIYHESVVGFPTTFFNGALTIPAGDAAKLQAAADAAVAGK